jgi:hypothetical protein
MSKDMAHVLDKLLIFKRMKLPVGLEKDQLEALRIKLSTEAS